MRLCTLLLAPTAAALVSRCAWPAPRPRLATIGAAAPGESASWPFPAPRDDAEAGRPPLVAPVEIDTSHPRLRRASADG